MKRVVIGTVVFALFVAMVFGFVLISELTSVEDPATKNQSGPDAKKTVGQPLVFMSSECRYDPSPTASLQNRMFRGFYEVGESDTAFFWFKNRSPVPVTITSRGASCTTCSAARITHVSPEAIDEYAKGIAISGMMGSLLPGLPNFLDARAAMAFDSGLPWEKIELGHHGSMLTLPAGGSAEKPGLGIVQLQISPSLQGLRDPQVFFQAGVEDEPPSEYKLQVFFTVVGNFAVRPQTSEIGELAEGATPRPLEILCWSATRDFGDQFQPPVIRANDDDPFVVVGKPVRFTREEIEKFTAQVTSEFKGPYRVLAAYRYPVTVLREANGKTADIGPFTKTLSVAGMRGEKPMSITVSGSVVGVIRLAEGKTVNFGTYEAKFDKIIRTTLLSEQKDLELEVVPGESKPRFLTASLDPPTIEGGAKVWKLNLKVAASQGFQANWSGIVVLRSKGPNPITIRVPVTGNGIRR